MYQVPLKIMGVKPPSSNDQMINDQNCFLRGHLDILSAFLKLVQLDLFLWMAILCTDFPDDDLLV